MPGRERGTTERCHRARARVLVTAVASVVAGGLAFLIDALIPPGSIPLDISGRRVLTSAVLLLVAAVIGCAFSLRRVLRVDPAAAIGTGS